MRTLTWLHLSDLHLRAGAHHRWDEDIVLRGLVADVRAQIDGGLAPDLVLLSGDLAYQGAPEEYELAGRFLDQLLDAAHLSRDRLFVVPGNHDVDRARIGFMAKMAGPTLTSREAINGLLADPAGRHAFLERFGGYADFQAGYLAGHPAFDDEQYFYARSLHLAGCRVAVLGLNSAWLAQGGKEERGRLALGERQVRAALDAAGDADLRLALLHHPFEWLHDADRESCEPLLARECMFILHGHLHKTALTLQQTPDARSLVIAAGAGYETRESRNSYNLVRLDLDAGQGTAFLRAWSDRQGGFWTVDTLTYQNAPEGQYTFPVGKPLARATGKRAGKPQAGKASAEPCVVDEATALPCYLQRVVEDHRRLQLQGIRSATGLVSIDLEEIYVTLTATVRRTVPDEERWVAEMAALAPGEAKRLRPNAPAESVQQVKVAVQEALAAHPRLVVLGDPGCGKTTLLRYLALTYARDWQAPGPVQERLQLDERRLPVLLPLRDLARYLEKEQPDVGADGPKLLLDYLGTYFENQKLPLPPGFFERHLEAGDCAVLLDGVDEVATMTTRQRVARLVEKFTLAYPGNRYVVTSRIVGYTAGARLGADYAVTTVRDFTDADVERFVRHWNRAVEAVLHGGATERAGREAERQAGLLLVAIRGNERVRELAVNPLLLTVIALVQRYRAALPERRVELYEEAIEVLLVQWDAVKGLSSTAVLQGLELDGGDRRGLLEPVALWMMEQRVREIELDDLRRQLAPPFFDLLKDWRRTGKVVDGFVQLIDERSGLLAQRGQGVYAFSHLTFQEHLAARAVADRADYVSYALARVGDSWWREVILLEAGYLSTQGKRRATELIQAVMECPQEPEPYHNLVLAAEAVRDVGQARLEDDLAGEIRGRLRRAFEKPLRKGAGDLPALIRSRAAAAEALARIEGGTFGAQPAFWRLPHGEPAWVEVPAGEFWMGGDGRYDGKPVHQAHVDRFWIARVPVTNAQYRFFVEAAGHAPPSHWEEGRPPKGKESHPVVRVSWYDALAYCRWLSEATGKRIRLPSEAEWEKAARGDQDRRAYPWGEEFEATRCNGAELDLGDTTPVGIFPEGASPCGALDMAGNVWEWCHSLYRPYPYRADDGRENLQADDNRVLRGGSWLLNRSGARCAARINLVPDYRNLPIGFRVVLSPGSPVSDS